MSKMKHLLRKLHIGGGLNEHQRLGEPRPDPITISPPPSASTSSASSSSAMPALPSPSPSTAAPPITRSDGVGADAQDSPADFNFFEEEFQVQLALAISASDPGSSLEDAETAQIKVAEQISLMGSLPSVSDCETLVDSLSIRYWNYNFINYDDKVADGFYDVYASKMNMGSPGKMPSLMDLKAMPMSSESIDHEVILVDRAVDPKLQDLENTVYCMSTETGANKQDPVLSGLVQKIADLVVCRMGGPVGDADDILRRWRDRSYEEGTFLNNNIVHLGHLDVGLSRHRALLFKVLADKINLPCMLVKGSYYTGSDEGAVNIIKTANGSEYIIDLMGAPGALIPAELPIDHLPNPRPDIRITAAVPDKLKDSVLQPKEVRTLAITCIPDSGSTEVGNSKSEHAGVYMKEDSNKTTEKNRTERFEHDFGNLLPSLRLSRENSLPSSGKESPAQKMQVSDVSKYVISAAKNPEFAQKLHAVLLESGASPPPDLFTNMDSEDVGEHKSPEKIKSIGGRMADDGVQCHSKESVSKDKQCSDLSMSSDSTTDGYVLVGCKTNEVTQASSAVDSCQRQHAEVGSSGKSFQKNTGSNPVLGEVTEWEIPWDDLQIGERIGIGSYGEVYRADWNGTEVAVKKFLNQDFFGEALIQFKYEAEIMIRLRHPNVVLFMGAVTRSPNSSILTEFLPRGSLYKLLHRTRITLDERRRMRMALDVAKGMNYLHTGHPPIVHRDLKSPNLLVDKNWNVKVCDFGLSRLKHHTFLSSKSTAGTAEWMAPEVLRNEPSNEKCDVYSFGVILWELATLRVPWSGMNPMQVVGAVGFQNRRLEIPEEIDPVVSQIILDCWQCEPHLRPSFSQLISRLRSLQRLVVGKK